LDEANYKFVSEMYYRDWKRGRSVRAMIAEVKRLNVGETKRRDALKAAGQVPGDL